jgi:hypothetical protein
MSAFAEQTILDGILGAGAADWKFSQPGSVTTLEKRPVLLSGTQSLTLSSLDRFPADMEYRLVFRLMPTPNAPHTSVQFQIGLSGPDDANQTPPGASFGSSLGWPYLVTHVSGGTNGWRTIENYHFKTVPQRRVGRRATGGQSQREMVHGAVCGPEEFHRDLPRRPAD